ncbi:hypothetical protein HPB49_011438 [Dermacentor silvarum]|uniref:Uncharacterized protein n=1 Tax=Dermacentor silvarum TaxID=543639 RepID=A0ACB8CEQ8_DERSI|nr:hypothetical protein HPB49_011438 [Dermacentor silvarum]
MPPDYHTHLHQARARAHQKRYGTLPSILYNDAATHAHRRARMVSVNEADFHEMVWASFTYTTFTEEKEAAVALAIIFHPTHEYITVIVAPQAACRNVAKGHIRCSQPPLQPTISLAFPHLFRKPLK